MAKVKFVDLFETNNFYLTFVSYVVEFVRKIEFLIFNNIFHDSNKYRAFFQKMVKIKFVDLFELKNFTF